MQPPRVRFYRLDDKNNVVQDKFSLSSFGGRTVAKDNVMVAGVQCEVSTVFMPIDHSFSDDGPPIVFETMIFGGVFNGYQDRYCTWNDAERGHFRTMEMVLDKRKIVKQCIYLIKYWFLGKWWSFKYFMSRNIVLWKRKEKNEKEV